MPKLHRILVQHYLRKQTATELIKLLRTIRWARYEIWTLKILGLWIAVLTSGFISYALLRLWCDYLKGVSV